MIPCKITVLESTLKVPEKHDICCWKSCFGEVAFVKLDCKTCLHTLIYVCTPCYFSMAIDNQLLCAQVEIYNSNWLSQFKCLNTNQVNETFFFQNFQISAKLPFVSYCWHIFQFIQIWNQHIIMILILAIVRLSVPCLLNFFLLFTMLLIWNVCSVSGDVKTNPDPKMQDKL